MDGSEETWDLMIFGDRGVGKSSFRLKVSSPTTSNKIRHAIFFHPHRCLWSILTVRSNIATAYFEKPYFNQAFQFCRRGATWTVSTLDIFSDCNFPVRNQPQD